MNWKSLAKEILESLPNEKRSSEEWHRFLKNRGVKDEELQFMEIPEAQSLTRDQVLRKSKFFEPYVEPNPPSLDRRYRVERSMLWDAGIQPGTPQAARFLDDSAELIKQRVGDEGELFPDYPPAYEKYMSSGGRGYREIVVGSGQHSGKYESSHFPNYPDPIVSLLMKNRRLVRPGPELRSTHLEEMQSDVHKEITEVIRDDARRERLQGTLRAWLGNQREFDQDFGDISREVMMADETGQFTERLRRADPDIVQAVREYLFLESRSAPPSPPPWSRNWAEQGFSVLADEALSTGTPFISWPQGSVVQARYRGRGPGHLYDTGEIASGARTFARKYGSQIEEGAVFGLQSEEIPARFMEVTEAMRERAKKGWRPFALAGAATGLGALATPEAEAAKIPLDPRGIGGVLNRDLESRGGWVKEMTPREFLDTAAALTAPREESLGYLQAAAREGRPFGNPSLSVEWDSEGQRWLTTGHEGRHRSTVLGERYAPEDTMDVHILPQDRYGVTPEMRQAPILSQDISRKIKFRGKDKLRAFGDKLQGSASLNAMEPASMKRLAAGALAGTPGVFIDLLNLPAEALNQLETSLHPGIEERFPYLWGGSEDLGSLVLEEGETDTSEFQAGALLSPIGTASRLARKLPVLWR